MQMRFNHSEMRPVYGDECFTRPDEENARCAEIHIRYRGAISRSSVAWTAASIVLLSNYRLCKKFDLYIPNLLRCIKLQYHNEIRYIQVTYTEQGRKMASCTGY